MILNQQTPLRTWLGEFHPRARFMLGLLGCSAVGCYVPKLVVAFFPGWIVGLTNLTGLAMAMVPIMIVLAIGNRLRRVMTAAVLFAAFVFLYMLYWTVFILVAPAHWYNLFPPLFISPAQSLVSGWLLVRYKRSVGLD